MNIGESSNAVEVSLGGHAKYVSDISDMSDISAIEKCGERLCIEEHRSEDNNYPPEKLKTEESSQIDQTESDVNGSVLDVSELYLDYRPNSFSMENEVKRNVLGIKKEANNSNYSEVKDSITEKQFGNTNFGESTFQEKQDSNSGQKDSGELNEQSKNFYNIEVEIARIVGEEVNQDNESWDNVDNEANLHNFGDQETEKPTESHSSEKGKEENQVDYKNSYVEALEEKTNALEDSKENIILKSENDSNDEEHENSIDEEEIEDYEMFLLNSSIDSDFQKQEETNEVYQTEILLIDPEDTNEAEIKRQCRVKGSDDDNDRQYDLMQLAEVTEVETLHRCSLCQYITPNLSSLRRHVSITHSKNPWTCKYCRKKFTSRFFGEKHIQSEHSRKNRKCPYCSFLTLCSATVMQKHITLAHGFKPIGENDSSRSLKRNLLRELMKCSQCAFSDKNREVMQTHIQMHSLEYVLRCIHCYYMINNRKMYDEHVKSTHKMAKKIFICTKCFFQSEEWEEYYGHINKPHDFHSCMNCEFKSPYIEIFYNHIRSHDKDSASEAIDNEILVCGKCGYKACSNDNLTCHLQAQHSENSRNESMEHIDDDGSLLKAESIPSILNIKDVENIIEFEEVEDTEDNGIGSKCIQELPNHVEIAEEQPVDCKRMDSKDMLEDNEKTHNLHPRENIFENADSKNCSDIEHRVLIESSAIENDNCCETPQCLELHSENEHIIGIYDCFDESNKYCEKCPFWSKNPTAFKVHMLSHNSKSRVSGSENDCEILDGSDFSLLSDKADLPHNVRHVFTIDSNRIEETSHQFHEACDDSGYRYSVHTDRNVFNSTHDNVDETERNNVDSSNLGDKAASDGNNCEELCRDTHTRGLKTVSSIPKRFKKNDSDEENLIGKVTEKPMKIVKVHKHQCFDCLLIYKTRYTLLDHRKKKHGLKKPHSCTYCMDNFETYNCLKSHYYRVHRVSYHNSGAFYKCPICDFTSIRKKHIFKHVSRQHFW